MARKSGPVAILLTPAEVDAIYSAAALHEAEYEFEGDATPQTRATDRALNRVIAKIHYARKGP